MFIPKGGKRITDEEYWALDMDKSVSKISKKKNKVDTSGQLSGASFIDFFVKMGENLA